MKHRAKVYQDEHLRSYEDFEFLCDAVEYCNTHSDRGDTCEVTEVYQSLTGTEEYGTITTWDFKREYV